MIWKFVVIGIFSGSIYALASMGVVLTYKTTGVFNFAYGAVAMFCAFTYWKLHDSWHLTAWLAMPILLLVVAPALGIAFELLYRPLAGLSAEVQIVVSLGVLAFLDALVPIIYGKQDRALEAIFPTSTFNVGGLYVGWDQLGTLLVSLAMGGGLWVLLRRTRFGTQTRAVVDNRDLSGMLGINGNNVRRVAWIISSVFAALVGIMLSPTQGLDVYVLTTVVIFAFFPAVLGRLTSLPIAFAGAIGLGIVQSVLTKWGSSGTIADLEASIPFLALFVCLVLLGGRLKELGLSSRPIGSSRSSTWSARTKTIGRVPMDLAFGTVIFLLAVVMPVVVRGPRLGDLSGMAIFTLIALTLVVLSGWSGNISLAQFTFVGVGAFTVGHLAGSHGQHFLSATLIGAAIAIPVGLIVGLPSLRLSGLFLALATMAFALLMDNLVFIRNDISGGLTGITDPRPEIFGINFSGRISFYELTVGVTAFFCLSAYLLYRGPIGRRLRILRDSPLAASTLGVNLTITKLATFAVCGAVAAIGGSLYGAWQQSITPTDFNFSASLALLLYVVIGGRSLITGAVIAGGLFAILLLPIPADVQQYIPLLIGVAVIGLASQPEGTLALTYSETKRVLVALRPLARRDISFVDLASSNASAAATNGTGPTEPVEVADMGVRRAL